MNRPHQATRRRQPGFFWQGVLIIAPALLLAGFGLLSLRQDRLLAYQEACREAARFATDLARHALPGTLFAEPPGLLEVERFRTNALSPAQDPILSQAFDVGQLDGLLDLRSWRADDDRVLNDEGDYSPPHDLLVVALVYGDLLTQRNYGDDEGRQWKPEYLITRFVAEAASAAGFKGILCGCVRYPGENLVVFDPAWTPKPLGEPIAVALDADALRLREGYFWNRGEALTIPDFSDLPIIGST